MNTPIRQEKKSQTDDFRFHSKSPEKVGWMKYKGSRRNKHKDKGINQWNRKRKRIEKNQ